MNDFINRHDLIQRLNKRSPLYTNNSNVATMAGLFICGISVGLVLMVTIRACDPVEKKDPRQVKVCSECHNRQMAMTHYFKKAGSKTPEELADAVLKTKSPRLLAAMAVAGEKNSSIRARNTGFKNRHSGAWQVNPRHWGTVPADAAGQALQAERIITELTTDHSVKTALSKYGGDSTDAYQKRVLAELVRVP